MDRPRRAPGIHLAINADRIIKYREPSGASIGHIAEARAGEIIESRAIEET
jgi:hypothetical protein